MILFAVLPLIATVAPFILGGLNYLRRQLLPSAPVTEPVGEPYTPPATGGQCSGVMYKVTGFNLKTLNANGSTVVNYGRINSGYQFLAPFKDAKVEFFDGLVNVIITSGNNVRGNLFGVGSQGATKAELTSVTIVRVDGQADTCGNVPNPNPSPSIATDGIATSTPPNPNNFLPLIAGIAAATAASFLAAKAAAAAALAAAKAAAIGGNVADAIAKLADALAEILKLLDELEKKKDEEKDEEKTVLKHDFGRVEKDGFLRLYPDENLTKLKLSYVDIQVENIPSYLGKYFGQKSPNYYRYKPLGYISFVSPTFGILETRQIDFRRVSLNPPENAFGFFYHFGLNGILKANLTGFYVKKEVPPPTPPA